MTFIRRVSLIVSYISVVGGIFLAILKVLDVLNGQGIKIFGLTVPFTGLLMNSTSIITVILAILFVVFSFGLVIGIRWNINYLILLYLLYTTGFLAYYCSIYFLNHFWNHGSPHTLRYVIPIGSMIFFLVEITLYYFTNQGAKEKTN